MLVYLLSTQCIAECLVSSVAHPVLSLTVLRPETYRIARVNHVALTDASLLVVRNNGHILLDDKAIVIGQFLTLGFCDVSCCNAFAFCILILDVEIREANHFACSSKVVKEGLHSGLVGSLRGSILAIAEVQLGIDTVNLCTIVVPDGNPVLETLEFLGVVKARLADEELQL